MAKIVTIDEEEKEILIHFMGWSSRFDEWIELSEDRVCKPSQQSLEEHVRRQRGKVSLLNVWAYKLIIGHMVHSQVCLCVVLYRKI